MVRHRAPTDRPWWRRLITPVVLVAALLGTLWLQQVQPGGDPFNKLTPEVQRAAFPASGAMDTWVRARTFDLRADAVTGSAQLAARANSATGPNSATRTSNGVFVVLTASIRAHDEPVSLIGWQLRDDSGRLFTPTDRWPQPAIGGAAQPGFVRTVAVVFEVPAGVSGLTLLASRAAPQTLRLDSQVQVRLPVTAATVTAWRASAAPVVPPPTRTVVAGQGDS